MKKNIYFIPGMGQSCKLLRYQKLARALEKKGYNMRCVDIDWYKPITQQIFKVEKNSIISGFSMGAIIAYLIARKHCCKKAIFMSLSPIHSFSFKELVGFLSSKMEKRLAVRIAKDIKSIKVDLKSLKCPYVTLAGYKEGEKADHLIPRTGHKITSTYIKYIQKII